MPDALVLRLAGADDFAAITDLTNHFIRTTPVHFGDAPLGPDELRQAWRDGLVYPWIVAEVDGAFCGYAKASSWRARAAYAWTAETTIYLRAERRGTGIGRRLYQRLVDVLATQGFRSLIGGITQPNPASVRLHERLGFRPCGTVADAGFKFGAWHAVGFWQLRLRTDEAPGGTLATREDAFARVAASDPRR